MPEPTADPLALEALALRYAAGRLSPAAAATFEARLATDQSARDALAEAVQLSAAALGQEPPTPDRSFRAAIRERLRPLSGWGVRWLARRAYRGHPAVWAGLGAGAVALATVAGLELASGPPAPVETAEAPAVVSPLPAVLPPVESAPHRPPDAPAPVAAVAPAPRPVEAEPPALRAAEIWADLSTPEHVEKAREDDARFRQFLRDLPSRPTAGMDDTVP